MSERRQQRSRSRRLLGEFAAVVLGLAVLDRETQKVLELLGER